MKDWAIAADQFLIEQGLDRRGHEQGIGAGGLLLMIHDSLVLLVPEGEAEFLADQVTKIGLDQWSRLFPGVPGEIEAKRGGV